MEQNKIPTAEEFSRDIEFITEHDLVLFDNIYNYAIEFAKMHVKIALEEASKKAWAYEESCGRFNKGYNLVVEKESILEAYPESNII